MKQQEPKAPKSGTIVTPANGMADLSLVLGVPGLLLSTLLGFWSLAATVPGLILGLIGLSSQTRRRFAVAGVITSALGIFSTLCWILFIVASFDNIH
ncbi:MAG TPA: hypothetical protein VJ183_08820 [Chloroflexia bacterium]|nr:hypothetical protein [Chloroflexia bacterium]